jgi:hypothetical protein
LTKSAILIKLLKFNVSMEIVVTLRFKNYALACLVLALFCQTSVAFAQRQSPVIAYLTDVEGKWQKFADFLKDNPHVFFNGGGKLKLADGVTFVYGGDATDSGPNNAEVVDQLIRLKKRYPARVILLAGNRDIGKLDLDSFLVRPLTPKLLDRLQKEGLSDTRTGRVKLLCELLGYPGAFDDRKAELALLKGRSVSDDDVTSQMIADIRPGGRQRVYLEKSQLMYRNGETLFVHGAVLDDNLGVVGNSQAHAYAQVEDWMRDLNQWYAQQINEWEKTGDASELVKYGKPVPGTFQNRASVVVGRYTDASGNSRMPSRHLIEYLKENGIRRIVVGHTPQGDGPTILRENGFEIIVADNTDAPHGSKLFITGHEVEVESKVRLPNGEETYQMKWAIDDDTPLGHRLASSDHLLKAKLKNGSWLTFQVGPPPDFEVEHRVISQDEVLRIGVKVNSNRFFDGLCAMVFGN